MRTFIVSLVIVLGTVAWLVQAVVAGYDSQFAQPVAVSTWQVENQGDGREVVTVWGQSFTVRADELTALVDSARTYVEHLPGVRGVLDGIVRQLGWLGGFVDSPAGQQDGNNP